MPRVALLAAAGTALLLVIPAFAADDATAVFSKDSKWGGGYQARYTITAGSSSLTGWKLEFDLPFGSRPGVVWDATLSSDGSHHTFVNREHNGSLAAGTSTTFGFRIIGSGTPTGCKLNGVPCGNGTPARPSTTGPSDVPPTPGNSRVAPYIDITTPKPSLAAAADATGHKVFTLAFAIADGSGCKPAWAGSVPLNDKRITDDVKALRAKGGGVIVATGGSRAPYLEHVCGNANALYDAYVAVLDAVGSNSLDVVVEANIPTAVVNTALKRLQDERDTTISYTMRVQGQDFGIEPLGVQILRDAASRGLDVIVNPLLMNFGFTGAWGDAMVSAANATLGQMKQIWPALSEGELRARLAVTPMIGKNDSGTVTTQADARQVLDFARANHVHRVSFWLAGRDNNGCPDGRVSQQCSGVPQSDWEFTNVFKTYTG